MTIPALRLRKNLSDVLNEVRHRNGKFLVTVNGRPAAVLMPVGEYNAMNAKPKTAP